MGTGEIVLIVILSLVVLFLLFVFVNNLKFKRKQKKIEKEKSAKDVQPIADVSPKPIQNQSNKGKEKPLNVNDHIFDNKLGYENITERIEAKELIQQEKVKENKDIVNKLNNITITSEPLNAEEFDKIDSKLDPPKDVKFEDIENELKINDSVIVSDKTKLEETDNQIESNNVEETELHKNSTVEIIKALINEERKK